MDRAVRRWASEWTTGQRGVLRIGYTGSYARGDWGPGSDIDLIVLVEGTDRPFEERGCDWDALALPVPADVLVYTREEWERLRRAGSRLVREAESEGVWVWPE